MQIIFIRHAESENNYQYFLHGNEKKYRLDPPLSGLGERQACALTDFLATHRDEYSFDHILISPTLRTLQTAASFTHLYPDVPKTVWAPLHEGGGFFEILDEETRETKGVTGMGRSEIKGKYPEYEISNEITEEGWYFLPEVEPHSHLIYRAFYVIEYLVKNYGETEQTIALVSHGNFHNHFIHAILRTTPQPRIRLDSFNTAITDVRYVTVDNNPSAEGEKWWFIGPLNRHEWLTENGLLRDWSKK